MNTNTNGRPAPSMVEMPSAVQVLKSVADSLENMPKQQYTPKPRPTMEGETQNLLNLASESVDRIFNHGTSRISKIEAICHEAKQTLENKRNAVNRSMGEYLAALEAVQKVTEDAARALSEVIVSADAMGN